MPSAVSHARPPSRVSRVCFDIASPTTQAHTSQLFFSSCSQSTPLNAPSETALLAWQLSPWLAGSLACGAQAVRRCGAGAGGEVGRRAEPGPGQVGALRHLPGSVS